MCLPYLKFSEPLPETHLFFYLAHVDRNGMMRKFCDWKIKHNDVKREVSEAFHPSPTWVLFDFLVTVKAGPHKCVIRTGQP